MRYSIEISHAQKPLVSDFSDASGSVLVWVRISCLIYYFQTAKKFLWLKWVPAAACIVLVISIGGIIQQSAHTNHVQGNSTENFGDQSDASNVSPEQAEKLPEANIIDNTVSKQMYSWYGSCYYDFETDTIMVGLTENTKENQAVY